MTLDPSHPQYEWLRNVYVDETSQTKHRFLLLGGLILPASDDLRLAEQIMQARLPELPNGEMGWKKVSRAKLAAYGRVVDTFFDNHSRISPLDFHCLVIDTHKLNHHKFNQGSGEIGFNKEVYQLLLKFGRVYRGALFHVYPDKRETRSTPEELRVILNRGLAKSGDSRKWPYRRVQFRDSSGTLALQLLDVLLGAVAFRLNRHHLADNASPSKCELSDYVLGRAGVSNVETDTALRGRFTIWHRKLR